MRPVSDVQVGHNLRRLRQRLPFRQTFNRFALTGSCPLHLAPAAVAAGDADQQSQSRTAAFAPQWKPDPYMSPAHFQIVLSGTLEEINLPLLEAISEHLRNVSGDIRLTVTEIKRGSIILTVRATRAALNILQEMHRKGELDALEDIPVMSIKEVAPRISVTPADEGMPSSEVQSIERIGSQSSARAIPGSVRLYVGNLPDDVTDAELEIAFSRFGIVSSAKVAVERDTGRSKGFGFVQMGSSNDTENAIKGLNGLHLEWRSKTQAHPLFPKKDPTAKPEDSGKGKH